METVKIDGDFSIVKNDKWYEVFKKDEILKTPGGDIAHTLYLPLAERLMQDWKEYGYYSYTEATSILSFHFSTVENFSKMEKAEILNMLNSMNWENSWTLQGCPTGNPNVWMQWVSFFGNSNTKIELIRKWMDNQTIMQLVASTCVYNAFMDYNVAYYMAIVVEETPRSKHKKAIKDFYNFYSMFDNMFDFDEFWKIFDCFRLYYGIHFKEDGKHLPAPEDN